MASDKNKSIVIVGGHGLGDCMLAFQCLSLVRSKGCKNSFVAISSRDEIHSAIEFLFDKEVVIKLPENASSSHQALRGESPEFNNLFSEYDYVYYCIPDLLFNNAFAFDFIKYGTNPQVIKQTRTLLSKSNPEKRIYCGFQTTTNGYLYQKIEELLKLLGECLPDYEIYYPNIKSWNNQNAFFIENKDKFPRNVKIDDEPDFKSSLNILSKSCYFIGTCNGPSHIAYHLGIPRLITDPQFDNLPWVARWKEDVSECLPINISPELIFSIVRDNLRIPQTLMIPRRSVALNQACDWTQKLYIKTI